MQAGSQTMLRLYEFKDAQVAHDLIAKGYVVCQRRKLRCRAFRTDGDMTAERPKVSCFLYGFPLNLLDLLGLRYQATPEPEEEGCGLRQFTSLRDHALTNSRCE